MVRIAIVAAIVALAAPCRAATLNFAATMNGASVVPPSGSTATGSLTATYDTDTQILVWTGTFAGLSGTPTGASLRGPAAAGSNGGFALSLSPAASPLKGAASLTDQQAAELEAGQLCVNISTLFHKGGEIRGQLLPTQ